MARKFQIIKLFFFLLILVVPLMIPSLAKGQTMTQEIQMASDSSMANSASESASQSASQPSKYQLPYPGILPDHPLYFLKKLRDRIINILTNDPLKKSEIMLKNADKNLSMTIVLVDQNKLNLAVATAEEGQQYLGRSMELLADAKKAGKDTKGVITKLSASLEKHEEVLLQLADRTQGGVKDSFSAMAKSVSEKRKSL